MLAFVHIEKAAGTSLIHVLRHNYFLRYMDVRPFSKSSNGLFTPQDLLLSRKINPFLQAIGGHALVPYSGLERVEPSIRYITILRDPVRRYVSQYRHWIEKKGLDISIERFMEREELWNFQTRKLAGVADHDAARKCLEERFLAVGVAEEFDQFLVLLKRAAGDKNFDIRYVVQNTARDKTTMSALVQQWEAEIRKRNDQDIALYDYVRNKMIPAQMSRYGEAFAGDLERFRVLNRAGPDMLRRGADYFLRKIYIEPVTGCLRELGGLPYKGSY